MSLSMRAGTAERLATPARLLCWLWLPAALACGTRTADASGVDAGSDAPERLAVRRLEVAQTLIQSVDDPRLRIAQGKPFVVRAFMGPPPGGTPPARVVLRAATRDAPSVRELALTCTASSYGSGEPTLSDTGAGAAPCTARLDKGDAGEDWAAPGLALSLAAYDASGAITATSDLYDLSAKVAPSRLVLPLCPRILVDSAGEKVRATDVGSVADLKNIVLDYYPFADVQLCPDAFAELDVSVLHAQGLSSAIQTQLDMEASGDLVLQALDAWRASRNDAYAGYVHLGLAVSSTPGSTGAPARDQAYQGSHGMTKALGAMSLVVWATSSSSGASSMVGGPLHYYQFYNVVAHELGHVLGLYHAPGCGADGYDPQFPYLAALPSNAADAATTAAGSSVSSVPHRGTIGSAAAGAHGYQHYELSNLLSFGVAGIRARNAVGFVYDITTSRVIGPGVGELPIESFTTPASPEGMQTYDLMGYCSLYYYDKWISDYSYWRALRYTLQRFHRDATGAVWFDDLSGSIVPGWD